MWNGMTRCSHCKIEIIGKVIKRGIFIPPSIFVPQYYCEECWIEVKQREREALPFVILILMMFFFILVFLILSNFTWDSRLFANGLYQRLFPLEVTKENLGLNYRLLDACMVHSKYIQNFNWKEMPKNLGKFTPAQFLWDWRTTDFSRGFFIIWDYSKLFMD